MHAMVLLSGGLDSTTVAAHAVREGYTVRGLSVSYGQRHAQELASARRVAAALGIPLQVASLDGFAGLAHHSALTNPDEWRVPQDEASSDAVPISYVPLRNTFFVTLAAAALESWMLGLIEREGADPVQLQPVILVGANAIDYSGYPDCRPEFYVALEQVLRLGSKLGDVYDVAIRIDAPLIRKSKADIVRWALELDAPVAESWSCYLGGERPCGRCDACRLRAQGFREAGLDDPALASYAVPR